MRATRIPVTLLTISLGMLGAGAAADAEPLPPPGGQLIVVAAAETEAAVTIDGSSAGRLGWATILAPQRVPAGSHAVSVGSAKANVNVGSGCSVLVVAGRPDGPSSPPALTVASDCPLPGPAFGAAAVRFLPVVPEATGRLGFRLGETSLGEVPPGTATRRVEVPAGEVTWTVTREGEPIRSNRQNLEADSSMTAVFAGGGERTPTLIWVTEGTRQPGQVARTTTFDTGETPPHHSGSATAVLLPLLLAVSLVVAVLRRLAGRGNRRPMLAAFVVAIMATGCQPGGPPHVATSNDDGPEATTMSEAPRSDRPREIKPPPDRGRGAVPVLVDFHVTPDDRRSRPVRAQVLPFDAAAIAGLPRSLQNPLVGWVAASGGIGQRTMVLLGHGPLVTGYGVFSDIGALRVGDPIRVADADGAVSTYVVEGAVQTPKGDLWDAIDAPTATPLLVLVTCAGPVEGGRHTDNLLVVAHLGP